MGNYGLFIRFTYRKGSNMDNKYQDLHIYNWKNHGTSTFREIEIKVIMFTKNHITIDFIKNETPMNIIVEKKYNTITID